VGIRIFSARGEEVFGAKPHPPAADQVPVLVRAAVTSGRPAENGDELALPIIRGERCGACHAGGEVLGVLTVGAARPPAPADDQGAALDTLTAIIRDGFYRVMLSPTAPRFNEYFAELARRVPGVRGAAVYGPDGKLAYGDPAPHNAKVLVRVAPLRSEPRCLGCHENANEMGGSTLAVAFEPGPAAAAGTLPLLVETALKQVMATGLGRLAIGFLDDVARTGAVRSLTLHDAEGRLFYDAFGRPSPPADVAQVLRTGAARAAVAEGAPEFAFVEPLSNERSCQVCHGSDGPMRGAIEIRLDTSEERAELASLRRSSIVYGLSTIVLVLVLLALGLYYTVIRPVRAIGSVADQVGAGRLDASVDVKTSDEMGRLGSRINDMVRGLREKLELSKFVSHDTLQEVESRAGTVARGGERRRVAVVFSDIRGFTTFAESHEPEAVVDMLNRCLQAQAEVVIRDGGDIDKFVGDEIMARFVGPGMALRATRAAVEMVEAVEMLSATRSGAAER
ncbi:MAG TPA: adenylate/guanylate cyclase domain-containing protein, partial [Gaiellaceae bacterium]